jgi:two-component system chemotaxis response regulator CheY
MKVLILDDSKAMRIILKKIMADIGCEVTVVGNGHEALSIIASEGNPDLILVDWNMPVMNGLEFIKAVRANPAHDSIKLMMVTTEYHMKNMNAAREAGVNEYMTKPFKTEIILEKLADMGYELEYSPETRMLKIKEHLSVSKSNRSTFDLYTEAAEKGVAIAQNKLGVMYANGVDVPRDYVVSYMWFNLAATQGNDDAIKARSLLTKKMTAEQITEAQRMSTIWLAGHPQK